MAARSPFGVARRAVVFQFHVVPRLSTTSSSRLISSVAAFPQVAAHKASLADPEAFWGEQALAIDWFKFPKRILTPASESPDGRWKWFEGGQLNTAWNCVGRHVAAGGKRADNIAMIYDSAYTNTRRNISYRELEKEVNAVAAMLQDHGVKKGDRVVIYFPMVPEGFIAKLACAKLGAVHSVVFGGFSPEELAKRIGRFPKSCSFTSFTPFSNQDIGFSRRLSPRPRSDRELRHRTRPRDPVPPSR